MVMVLESIFGFDLSLPLNYLLKGFEEKTLVIQVSRFSNIYWILNLTSIRGYAGSIFICFIHVLGNERSHIGSEEESSLTEGVLSSDGD